MEVEKNRQTAKYERRQRQTDMNGNRQTNMNGNRQTNMKGQITQKDCNRFTYLFVWIYFICFCLFNFIYLFL